MLKRYLLKRKRLSELLDLYFEKLHEPLPLMYMSVTEEELREKLIEALLTNKRIELKAPKGCII